MPEPASPPDSSQKAHTYRPDIDGLRAIAVLAVIVFHAQPRLLRGGFVGVDVFFVISGFLITGIILERQGRGTFTIRDFYARRIRRIFPALSIVMLTALIAGWWFLLPSEYSELGRDTAGGAGFVSNLLLWKVTSYFDPNVNSRILLHLWSLGVEEQYYLVWPLLLIALARMRNRLVPIALLLLASFALNVFQAHTNPRADFYSPLTRLWELLLGSIIAYVVIAHGEPLTLLANRLQRGNDKGNVERTLREAASVAGLGLVLAGIVVITEARRFPGWWALLPTVGTALLICAGPATIVNRTVLANRAMVAVGLISYPLYLWHWPALVFLRLQFPGSSIVVKAAILVGVFVASWLTYQLVERRVRRSRSTRVVLGWSAVMALIFVAGLALVKGNGVPNRGDALHRRIFQVSLPEGKGNAAFSEGTCFVMPNRRASILASRCFPARTDSSRAVLLWGDSYAAHLAPGIQALQPIMPFGQLTGAGCPPIVGYAEQRQPHCVEMSKLVTDWIRAHPPDVVILSAHWHAYRNYTDVERTLAMLRDAGVKQVLLLGSYAQFDGDVPRLLLRAASRGDVPQRLPGRDMVRLHAADSTLSALASRYGAMFVSPVDRQCDQHGCLAALDTGAVGITTLDDGHLTATGARWLVPQLLAPVLPH